MSGSNIARAGVLLLAALCLPGGATQAAVSSPFVAMAGSWSGGGVLSTTDGMQERLRCRRMSVSRRFMRAQRRRASPQSEVCKPKL